jgi:hypothetical protein
MFRKGKAMYAVGKTQPRRWFGVLLTAGAVAIALFGAPAYALVGISGTMSNFDVFNDTTTNAYGAELEMDGFHSTEITKTYPSHFDSMAMTEYVNGTTFGTRLTFTGYNFLPIGYIEPTVGINTNGHYAVNLPGCEHFGFSVARQPSATRFFWLDQSLQRIGPTPMSIPTPVWAYYPPIIPGNLPVIQAVVQVPEPVEVQPLLPDSIWMKVYVTELARPVDLLELISGPDSVAPHDAAEIETEWELLEGGLMSMSHHKVGNKAQAVLRRYEYFKYTGPYKAEDHSPISSWTKIGDPPADELGHFIAANMVAAIIGELPPIPGDLNGDGTVDIADLLDFSGQWLGVGVLTADLYPHHGDQKVDLADLAVLASNWLVKQ